MYHHHHHHSPTSPTLIGYAGRESEMMTFVEDRCFNDLRYHINSDRLIELGWKELVSWEEGIARYVQIIR